MIDRLGGFFGSRDADEDFDEEDVEDFGADVEPPPSPVGQDERRMQVRAYNHWASLLGDRNFAPIDQLEPETLADFGPFSVLLDLTGDVEDPRLRYVGQELADECALEAGPVRLSNVPSRSVLSRITDHYMQILANQAPIGFEAEFDNAGGATVLYRGILLPYSSDDTTIDFIYGVINWKEMADQQTADALLLELDQALEAADYDEQAYGETLETAETLTAATQTNNGDEDDRVLELGAADMMDHSASGGLPRPSFGAEAEEEHDWPESPKSAPLSARLDALGNPVGGQATDRTDEEEDEFDGGMKTAADYGLPDWDEEEDPEEDVDEVVDPLADEETSSSLVALVNRGDRTKKSVDLSLDDAFSATPETEESEGDTFPNQIPTAYEPPAEIPNDSGSVEPASAVPVEETSQAIEAAGPPVAEGADFEIEQPDVAAQSPRFEAEQPVIAPTDDAPDGLHDCLAAAREMAQAAQSTEDRSRKTLYEAVGRAYDFSLEAEEDPDGFDRLLADNDLTVQDRAPMTPVVKLVFGVDYDKTRLTEYAAVLMHGHRIGVERGQLAGYLREAEGGLKGVVQAERQARKEEQGKPVDDTKVVRPKLAKQLRECEAVSLAELDEQGPEFALVMVRRTPEGALEIIGEVPEDIPLVERAARKLLG